MRLPRARGPVSARVLTGLRTGVPVSVDGSHWCGADVLTDDDLQLALWSLYELEFRGFDDVDATSESDPDLLGVRADLERVFERAVREVTSDLVAEVPVTGDVGQELLDLAQGWPGQPVAAFLHRAATREQVLDFLRVRSVYHLKESDPHAMVLGRLDGPAKAALAELLYDEYGGGRPERLHASLYAETLDACGLDSSYGAYVDDASAATLAVNNLMSMLGLNRRLRGAAMGHLAAFEATSSVPCRKIAAGMERVGLPSAAAAYFHEHVEADAVHEQVAARDICGSLVAAEPSLRADVLLGAVACLYLDDVAGGEQLAAWAVEPAA